jgi:hypothetical protein
MSTIQERFIPFSGEVSPKLRSDVGFDPVVPAHPFVTFEIAKLSPADGSRWNSLSDQRNKLAKRYMRITQVCGQDNVSDSTLLSAALTKMSLEILASKNLEEAIHFASERGMVYSTADLRSKDERTNLPVNTTIGSLSITEFLSDGDAPEKAAQSLSLLINSLIPMDQSKDLEPYKAQLAFEARCITRSGLFVANGLTKFDKKNSQIHISMDDTDIVKDFTAKIKIAQENIRMALLDPAENSVKKEIEPFLDVQNAAEIIHLTLGFVDSFTAISFWKKTRQLANSDTIVGNGDFYKRFSARVLEYVEKYDPNSLVDSERLSRVVGKVEDTGVIKQIQAQDFNDATDRLLLSKTVSSELVRPEDTRGVDSPYSILIDSGILGSLVRLVWKKGKEDIHMQIYIDRQACTINWSALDDINSDETRPSREALLGYVLDVFNLTANALESKNEKVVDSFVEIEQSQTPHVVSEEKSKEKSTNAHPQVRLDCPIYIDPIKVEALILASNIRKIHRQKVLAALADWNAGKSRMLSRVDDKTFKLHVGKVAVSLQEEGGILSIMEISYSK